MGSKGEAWMNQGSCRAPIRPADWPGINRPVEWTSFSGRTTAGGRLWRGAVDTPATAAMEGQSEGFGRDGSNPEGRSERPVSIMWCAAEWSFDSCVSDLTRAQ